MTYSIVARCQETGNLGVAVQSHWFASGIVCWAKSGVGAVATQAMTMIDHGPLGLDQMEQGKSAKDALEYRMSLDDSPEIRQVAMVDSSGQVAIHTGGKTIPEAGHIAGDGVACQANMMWSASVWKSMHDRFVKSSGDLAQRMLESLKAAQEEGGDIRGMQSSRILVVNSEPSNRPWKDVLVDVRVDDHPQPLLEIERLLDLHNAYANLESRNYDESVRVEIPEIAFWTSVDLARRGLEEKARRLSKIALEDDAGWEELLIRCSNSGLAGITGETVRILLGSSQDSS
jgi:uncharacterized Ntn-hydrolase superfamily protein